jgi:hypothetical protein
MNNLMGNQQVTSQQLAWLAGIWDGEGSFCISYIKKGSYYTAAASITNSSSEMIVEVTKIIDKLSIGCHIWLESLRTKKHKQCYHLTVRNNNHLKLFIESLLPYLIAKKAQAEIELRFVNSRLKYQRTVGQDAQGRLTGVKKQLYSEDEVSAYEQLRKLNAFGIQDGTSETIRRASDRGMMI